jgi:hypothetical protein
MGFLDRRRRLLAVPLVALGLCTFVVPTITTDPPVLTRVRWSPLDILTQIHKGAVPTRSGDASGIDGVQFYFAASYLLLLFALLTITVLPSRKVLVVIALLNALISSATGSRHGPSDFWTLFYGSLNPGFGQVHLGQHMLLLFAVNLLLLGIVFYPKWD